MNGTLESLSLQPYLFFEGRCEEALEFYRRSVGAEVMSVFRFKESPEPPQGPGCAPGNENKIMHATFRIGQTIVLASDGHCHGQTAFQGFALCLNLAEVPEAERLFKALSDGGQVQMPMTKTFYSPAFGMIKDRFGVLWMVYTRQQQGSPG